MRLQNLGYPELRIAIEYEGEHHLTDPLQWAEDIARATPALPAPRITPTANTGIPASIPR